MKNKRNLHIFTAAFMAFAFTACDSDDDNGSTPPGVNDEEVITDLVLTFENPDTQTSDTFTFSDPDGPSGEPPTKDAIILSPGVYILSISVLDASDPNNVEDLTPEIAEEEADEHQFFFELTDSAQDVIAIDYSDQDEDGNPIGQLTTWSVTAATSDSASVRVTLVHEPDKNAPGANEGILSNEIGGETDIEVDFQLTITE